MSRFRASILQDDHRYPAEEEDDTSHQTCAATVTQTFNHLREPEWSDETPCASDEIHENADAARMLIVAVHGVRHAHRRNDLIANGRNGNADNGSDVPLSVRSLLYPDAENDDSDYGEEIAKV